MIETVETTMQSLHHHGITGSIETAIVLSGSSGSPAEAMTDTTSVPYAELPGFPQGIAGGRIVVGTFEGVRLAVLEGREFYHESGDVRAMQPVLETVARLGARIVLLGTNAVSLQGDCYPGSVAIVSDHVNVCGHDPLVGVAGENRAVVMRDAYDQRLRRRLKAVASTSGVPVHEGVFFAVSGPTGETAAEARMAKGFGADLLGHGLPSEVILARWLGLRVAALAIVTGFAAGIGGVPGAQGVKDGAMAGSIGLRRLLRAFLRPVEE